MPTYAYFSILGVFLGYFEFFLVILGVKFMKKKSYPCKRNVKYEVWPQTMCVLQNIFYKMFC